MRITMLTLACLLMSSATPLLARPTSTVTMPTVQDQAVDAETLGDARRRLAEIELLVTVDRDIDGAQTALDTELARWQSETPALLAEPEVVAARLRIERLLDDATRQDSSALAEAVSEALWTNRSTDLDDIGPAGLDLVLAALDSEKGLIGGRSFDTQRLIWGGMILDGDRLVEHLYQRWQSGAGSSASQVIDVLQRLINTTGDPAWSVVPGYEPKLREPAWLDMLATALADPSIDESGSTANSLEAIASILIYMNAFTPELCDAFADFVMATSSNVASRHMRTFESLSVYVPSAQLFLERLLNDVRPDVRRRAAGQLTKYPHSDALLALVDDPDPAMRLSVITAIEPRTVTRLVWRHRAVRQTERHGALAAPDSAQSAELLTRLSLATEPVVREAVLRVIDERDLPIAPEVFRRLARDEDPGVRRMLAGNPPYDEALRVEILTELARDPDIVVARAVDMWLGYREWDTAPIGRLAVVRARLLEAAVSVDDAGSVRSGELLEWVAMSQEGRIALAGWTLETGDSRFVAGALPRDWARFNTVRGREELVAPWLDLPPSDVVALLRVLETARPEVGNFFGNRIAWRLRRGSDQFVGTCSEALRDETLTVQGRMYLATAVAARSDPDDVEALLAFLRDPAVLAEASQSWMPTLLESLGEVTPADVRNGFLLAVLRETSVPDAAMREVASTYRSDTDGSVEVIVEIVERWLGEPDEIPVVARAVDDLATAATPRAAELLLRASEHSQYVESAVRAMGRRRDPAFLPRLEECLSADWLGSSSMSSRYLVEGTAAAAVSAYMSEDAAEILLRGAATVETHKTREQCLAGAEMIRSYLEGLDEWSRRKASRATRESAIADLLPMLEDEAWEVRLQAARALGTLGAVEHMPKLIALLRDPDQEVRDAAHAALDRLNAQVMVVPAEEEPTPDGEQPPGDG
jgi:hypothetical protein